MLIAVEEEDHLPEWLYPYRLGPLSGEALKTGSLTYEDFCHLWSAFGVTPDKGDAFDMSVPSNCDVGFHHGAIESVPRLNPGFVAALAGLPDAERWRVAQSWTTARLGRRPNAEQLAHDKKQLKPLCEFAARAIKHRWLVVFIEDDAHAEMQPG